MLLTSWPKLHAKVSRRATPASGSPHGGSSLGRFFMGLPPSLISCGKACSRAKELQSWRKIAVSTARLPASGTCSPFFEGSWRCFTCGVHCRTRKKGQVVQGKCKGLLPGAVRAHRSHKLFHGLVAGSEGRAHLPVIFCTICGCHSSSRVKKLAIECCGWVTSAGKAFARRKHPALGKEMHSIRSLASLGGRTRSAALWAAGNHLGTCPVLPLLSP